MVRFSHSAGWSGSEYVCVSDEGSSRVTLQAGSLAKRLLSAVCVCVCVCVCVWIDGLRNVATAGAKPFHNMGSLAKGIMQSGVSECLCFVCVCEIVCLCVFVLSP